MANKVVLTEAIKKLEYTNMTLREKMASSTKEEKEKISSQIARNESMILDYQFRLYNQ